MDHGREGYSARGVPKDPRYSSTLGSRIVYTSCTTRILLKRRRRSLHFPRCRLPAPPRFVEHMNIGYSPDVVKLRGTLTGNRQYQGIRAIVRNPEMQMQRLTVLMLRMMVLCPSRGFLSLIGPWAVWEWNEGCLHLFCTFESTARDPVHLLQVCTYLQNKNQYAYFCGLKAKITNKIIPK